MIPQYGKILRQPLFAGPHLANPSSPSRKSITLRKKVSQAFQGHQEHQKPTPGATSIMRVKTNGTNGTMLKIPQFSPGEVAFALRFFLIHYDLICKSTTLRKRTCSNMTYSSRIAKILLDQAGISTGKQPSGEQKTLRRPLFAGPYLASPSSTSRKSTTLRKKVSQDF